jgi:ribose 1,5-bisphosphokinase
MPPAADPARAGAFVAVVGPSGAGKDTLLGVAQEALAGDPGVVFVRRVVTRPSVPSLEDHDSLSTEEFLAARAAGRFCVTWEAHGLHYGLPREVAAAYEDGLTVVGNVSRAALDAIALRFPKLHVVEITAPRDILLRRLVGRDRESRAAVETRLARSAMPLPAGGWMSRTIDNSGPMQDAASALVAMIEAARHSP